MKPEINTDEVRGMMKAYIEGDLQLSSIPDSLIKTEFLKLMSTFKDTQNEVTPEQIEQYRTQLETGNEEEQTKTILHILDNHLVITPELKAILEPHRELLLRIKRVNKDTGKSDPVWE